MLVVQVKHNDDLNHDVVEVKNLESLPICYMQKVRKKENLMML